MSPLSKTVADSLVLFEIGESNKGKLVSHKSFGSRKGLYVAFIILNLIKVTSVNVTAELWYHWSSRCEKQGERQRE